MCVIRILDKAKAICKHDEAYCCFVRLNHTHYKNGIFAGFSHHPLPTPLTFLLRHD
jgi:hypothetical protein